MSNETKYGRYVIRSMKVSDGWRARAFRGKRAVGTIISRDAEEAVILASKAAIDSSLVERRARRGTDGFPTVEEVREAFFAIELTDEQRAMLDAHLSASDHILTATELAAAAGYDHYSVANSQYGRLGRKLAEELEWIPPSENGKPIWTFTLATGADGNSRPDIAAAGFEHWRWKLRLEVVQALEE